jgi:hypothetical protein
MDFPIQNMCLGIDPGTVNMGLAIIHQYLYPFAELFQIKMERLPDYEDAWLEVSVIGDNKPDGKTHFKLEETS